MPTKKTTRKKETTKKETTKKATTKKATTKKAPTKKATARPRRASAAPTARAKSARGLTLGAVRKAQPTKLKPHERAQLEAIEKQIEAPDQAKHAELIDVAQGGAVVYQFWTWPFGDGAVFEAGTTKIIARVVQHGFEGPVELAKALEGAFAASGVRFAEGAIDFPSEPPATTASKLEGDLVAEARRVMALPETQRDDRIDGLIRLRKAAGFSTRWPDRSTVASWEELTPEQQGIAKVIAETEPGYVTWIGHGLPRKAKELLRFVGAAPPGPLESRDANGDVRWRVIAGALAGGAGWDDAVDRGLAGLSPVERARGLLDVATDAYNLLRVKGASHYEVDDAHLAEAIVQAGTPIVPLVTEILDRDANPDAFGPDPILDAYGSHRAALVAALERVGVPIKPEWRLA